MLGSPTFQERAVICRSALAFASCLDLTDASLRKLSRPGAGPLIKVLGTVVRQLPD